MAHFPLCTENEIRPVCAGGRRIIRQSLPPLHAPVTGGPRSPPANRDRWRQQEKRNRRGHQLKTAKRPETKVKRMKRLPNRGPR